MGRGTSFPFYPALQHEIGSGFPHFMAHACMHRRGVSYEDQEAHFRRWEHHFPRENPPPHVFNGAYRALGLSFTDIVKRDNPELTLDPASPPRPGGRRGVNHVFSMILTDLYREYGAPYVEVYLEDLTKMDAADSAEAVEQNMLDAALSAHYATSRGAAAVRRLQTVWRMNPDWRPRPWPTWGRPFSDHPIVPHVTPVQALHFAELRERIDEVRSAAGLTAFSWTDTILRAGVTRVRLVHLLELREALGAAYAALGRPAPVWTDPVAVSGTTAIRAAHLMELRAAVLELERPPELLFLGGLNLNEACRIQTADNEAHATLNGPVRGPNAAYSWACVSGGVQSEIDFDRACRDTYGSDAIAQADDDDYAYSWGCYRNR